MEVKKWQIENFNELEIAQGNESNFYCKPENAKILLREVVSIKILVLINIMSLYSWE